MSSSLDTFHVYAGDQSRQVPLVHLSGRLRHGLHSRVIFDRKAPDLGQLAFNTSLRLSDPQPA